MIQPHLISFSIKGRIFVAGKNGKGQIFQRNIEIFGTGQKIKAHINGFFFEIVAQTPVAEHFKKGQMHGIAHIVDIAGTHTLLHVGQTIAGGVFGALQKRHQRMHPRGGEKTSGVVIRHQRSAFDHTVAMLDKKIQIFLTNRFCFHD